MQGRLMRAAVGEEVKDLAAVIERGVGLRGPGVPWAFELRHITPREGSVAAGLAAC